MRDNKKRSRAALLAIFAEECGAMLASWSKVALLLGLKVGGILLARELVEGNGKRLENQLCL